MANFDNGGPLARASAKGTVKWFNATKGYGFITLEDGADAFCHASALVAVGAPSLNQGATIVCDLQDSPRGLQVVAVHNVDNSTAEPGRPSRPPRRDFGDDRGGFGGGDRFGGGGRGHHHGGDRFGGGGDRFGGNDRFSSGGGSGVLAVEPEQRIRFSTRQGNKGVEVDRIEVV